MRIFAVTLACVFLATQCLWAGGHRDQFEDLVEIARAQAGLRILFSAARTYEEALSLSVDKEDKVDTYYELAALYSDDLADTSESISTYLRIIEMYDGSDRTDLALYRVGLLLEEMGKCYSAVDYYEKIIVGHPDSKYVNYALEGSERCFQSNFKGEAAVVNGEAITVVELEGEINRLPMVYRTRYSTPEGKKEYLEKMIKDSMVKLYCREIGVFDDPLVLGKIDDAIMRILSEQFLLREVRGKVAVSDEEIEQYYEEHKEDFIKPEEVRVRHILLETEEEALSVRRELETGKDFTELAGKFSIDLRSNERGGDLGYITPGRTVKVVEEAAFSLEPGEMSEVLKSRFGYHIVKVEDKKPEAYRSLSEVKALMVSEVRRIKEEKRSKELMAELKQKYNVKVVTDQTVEDTEQH